MTDLSHSVSMEVRLIEQGPKEPVHTKIGIHHTPALAQTTGLAKLPGTKTLLSGRIFQEQRSWSRDSPKDLLNVSGLGTVFGT